MQGAQKQVKITAPYLACVDGLLGCSRRLTVCRSLLFVVLKALPGNPRYPSMCHGYEELSFATSEGETVGIGHRYLVMLSAAGVGLVHSGGAKMTS